MIGTDHTATAPRARLTWLWPLLLVPMFFQLLYYKRDVGPFYLLAKGWPLLVAPLVLYGMVALRLPRAVLYIAFLFYALLVTPALSLVHLPNDVVDAALSTIRAWPVAFYFAVPAALVLLRPSEVSLRRAALGVGFATFALMWLLWLTVPLSWYDASGVESSLFSWDAGRDYFIRMPMALGHVAIFWLGRRLATERRPGHWLGQAALMVAALVSLALIYKARLPTGTTILILALGFFGALPLRPRLALAALAALPVVAATMIYGPDIPGTLSRTFDASLFIRLRSFEIAWTWMTESPARLLFGTGSISTFSDTTLADFLGFADFWLTDIGWVGVAMEYGLLGTALMVMIYLRAYTDLRAAMGADPFRRALADFVLLEILTSGIYSVMYAPGPTITCAALAWWFAARDAANIPVASPADLTAPPPAPPLDIPAWAAGVPVPQPAHPRLGPPASA